MCVFVPFVGVTMLAWVTLPIGTAIVWSQYWASAGLVVLAGLVVFGAVTGRVGLGVVPGSLLYLIAVGLLRNAGGGLSSGAGVVALVPVFYAALASRSRIGLGAVVAAVGALYVVPIVFIGGAHYPAASQYRGAILIVAIGGIIGPVIQSLVVRAQSDAHEAVARGFMLEQVTGAARSLFDSPRVRDEVCEAAARISAADVAVLYERRAGRQTCTAMAGRPVAEDAIGEACGPLVDEVYRSGAPKYLDGDVSTQLGSPELWSLCGAPTALLCEPLVYRGVVVGALVVAWSQPGGPDVSGRTVTALLAHEAAGAISRADALVSLVDEAQTDPLTGLPNRRAWDAAFARALNSGVPLTVAMLDLDNFKQFNDSFGHPAGDTHLRTLAAGWRELLRTGDLLARLGGEEFGLLICDASQESAFEIVERLRARVPDGRTCSAGIATSESADSAEGIIARADSALYEAKAAGRDRACVSELVS
jgi:diguanylate cyclase (GGDEF)-like protein